MIYLPYSTCCTWSSSGKKQISPSQIRRRERREVNSRIAEKANTNGVDADEKADEAFMEENNLKKRNNCVLCERTFATDQGLKFHIGRVHKPSDSPIPQIDGNFEEDYLIYDFMSDYGEEYIWVTGTRTGKKLTKCHFFFLK